MAKVIAPFRDRETWAAFEVGDDYEGDRVDELAALGFVEADKPKQTARRTRKTAPKE